MSGQAPAGDESGLRVAVLASGRGSNLEAILDRVHGSEGVEVVGVVANVAGAPALERARSAGVETAVFERDRFAGRDERDEAIADWLAERDVDLVVLAGYMELLSTAFVRRFEQRVINVHPALLPAFPGLDAIGQALDHGVRVTGVTVHFVDEGVDTGPIILQRAIEVPPDRDREALEEAIHAVEHELLPQAIRLIASRRVRVEPGTRLVTIEGERA